MHQDHQYPTINLADIMWTAMTLLCVALVLVAAYLVAVALALGIILSPAAAQTPPVVVPTPPTVTVSDVVMPVVQYILAFAAMLISAALTWAINQFNKWLGLQKDANILAIEKQFQETVQRATENAAGRVIMLFGKSLDGKTLAVGDPAIREAVYYVVQNAPKAVDHFGLQPDRIAQMVINKVGVLTAPNPAITPKTPDVQGNVSVDPPR